VRQHRLRHRFRQQFKTDNSDNNSDNNQHIYQQPQTPHTHIYQDLPSHPTQPLTPPPYQNLVIDQTSFDYRRCLSMMTFGGLYNGFINLYVYNLYSRYFPSLLRSTPLRFGVAATLVDNFVHVPAFYTPGFYYITGVVQGQGWGEMNETLRNGYYDSTVSCWALWVPVQFCNFAFVPRKYRALVVCGVGLGWNVVLDVISHRAKGRGGEGDKERRELKIRTHRAGL
jgi:hypothetical protein